MQNANYSGWIYLKVVINFTGSRFIFHLFLFPTEHSSSLSFSSQSLGLGWLTGPAARRFAFLLFVFDTGGCWDLGSIRRRCVRACVSCSDQGDAWWFHACSLTQALIRWLEGRCFGRVKLLTLCGGQSSSPKDTAAEVIGAISPDDAFEALVFALQASGGGLWANGVLSFTLHWGGSNEDVQMRTGTYLQRGWGQRFSVSVCLAGWAGLGLCKILPPLWRTAAQEWGKDRQGLSWCLSPRISGNRKWSWLAGCLPSAHEVYTLNSPKLCVFSYQRYSAYLPEEPQKNSSVPGVLLQGHTLY